MTPDERDRLTRLETKVDYIIENMNSLPISPETKEHFANMEAVVQSRLNTLEKFQEKVSERIAYVAGAFSILAGVLGFVAEYIWNHITISLGGTN